MASRSARCSVSYQALNSSSCSGLGSVMVRSRPILVVMPPPGAGGPLPQALS